MALLFTLAATSATQLWVEHRNMLVDAESTGNIISFNASAALMFEDKASAADILKALNNNPNVIAAQLYNVKGKPIARYSADGGDIDLPRLLPEPEKQLARDTHYDNSGQTLSLIKIEFANAEIALTGYLQSISTCRRAG